jgi:hypothetical protein
MKAKPFFVTALISVFIMCTLSATYAFSLQEERMAVTIPPQVKAVFQAGMESRQPRGDIPFQITNLLYLPAGPQNLYAIFFFKAKNADLGYAPPSVKPQAETPQEQPAEAKLVSHRYAFLQFNKLETATPGELVKEIYIPMQIEVDSASYNPEEEGIYTTGYPLPPGNYLLSMAITSQDPDFQTIGAQYFEFSIPDPFSFTEALETTPIFFARSLKQVAAAETVADIHKDYFAYSILQIEPNLERVFSPQNNLDIFFYIFGSQASAQGLTDIDIHFEVFQGEEVVINFAQQKYSSPLVSQELPMKKTVLVKTTKGTETTETRERRDLEPGSYTLSIDIKDNTSGKTVKKTIDFEVRT